MLTKAQIKKYVSSGGILCPYCNSDNIDSHMNSQGYANVSCDDCEKSWREIWKLVDIEEDQF